MNGIHALGRETRVCSESLLFAMWSYSEKTVVCEPGSRISPDTRSASTLIFDFQPPEL